MFAAVRRFLARHRKAEVAVAEAAGLSLAKKLAALGATGAVTAGVTLTGAHLSGQQNHGTGVAPSPACVAH